MKLKELLSGTGLLCNRELHDTEIKGIACDSRKVQKDDLFVCLKGSRTDGHIFAADAAFRGASVIISEEEGTGSTVPVITVPDTRKALASLAFGFYGHPDRQMRMVGVTGTNGKTTVSYMVRAIFEKAGSPCGLIGTTGYLIGDEEYEAVNTTPESLDTAKLLFRMNEAGMKSCSMEVSSHALALRRVDSMEFDYAIFTNLTADHLDFHKDSENYYEAKKKLFYKLRKSGIINIDDAHGSRLLEETKADGIDVLSYSLIDKKADFYADVKAASQIGSVFDLHHKGAFVGELRTNSPGLFNVYNALAASGCSLACGLPFECIKEGLSGLSGVPGRFELVENSRGVTAIVDYAHTPDALEKALKTARDITEGKLICVFGCGGDRDKSKREVMGEAAGLHGDYCIITNDNPRTENPTVILDEIKKGINKTGCSYEVIADRREAIKKALMLWQEGDTVLIAGKGHENYQIIGAGKSWFSDKETAKELIEEIK